jgi:peptidoglycan/LPS O-acetylase OafA/YrhL
MPGREQSSPENSRKSFRYQPALDGIRAIAVLLVMANHTGFFHAGRLGVDIFFVLSGYLITAILVSEFSANGRINLKKFYARRALRILPAVIWFLLIVNICVAIFQTHREAVTVRWDSLGALFYIANWLRAFGHDLGILGHLWSLSIEEQFYFFWPVALVFLLSHKLSARQIIVIAVLAILIVNVDRFYLYNGIQSYDRIFNGLDTRADALLIGCALGLSGYEIFSQRVFAALGLLGAILVCYILFVGVPANFQLPFELTIGGALFAIGVVFVLAALLSNQESIFTKVLQFPPLVWTGRLSYGLYLWHYFVFAFIASWFRKVEPLRLIPFQVLGTFVCAALSYYFVERPFLRLKKKFSVIKTPVPLTPNPLETVDH